MEVMFHIIAFALIVICFVVFVLTGFIAFLIVHSRFGSAQQSRQEGRQRPGYWGFLLKGLWSNRFLRTTGFLVLGLFLALMCQAFISDFYAAGEIRAGFASASRLVVRSGGNCHQIGRAHV